MDNVRARRGLILAAGALGIVGSASTIAAAIAETHTHQSAPPKAPAPPPSHREHAEAPAADQPPADEP